MNRPHPHTSKASTLPAELHTALLIILYILTRQDVIICFLLFRRDFGWPGGLPSRSD